MTLRISLDDDSREFRVVPADSLHRIVCDIGNGEIRCPAHTTLANLKKAVDFMERCLGDDPRPDLPGGDRWRGK